MDENYRFEKSNDMNTKKGFLKITTVFSIAPIILGILIVIFSDSADGKAKGLTIAVIGPTVIWGIYGAAYFTFKGTLSN